MPTYIRVKDLPNAATSPAADDFILLSGTANGARKISRSDFIAAIASQIVAAPSTYKIATLDGADKLTSSQDPSQSVSYLGGHDMVANSPALADGSGTAGDTYYVTNPGTRNYGSGNITAQEGDALVYSGSVWQLVEGIANILDGISTASTARTTLEVNSIDEDAQANGTKVTAPALYFNGSSSKVTVANSSILDFVGDGNDLPMTISGTILVRSNSTNFFVWAAWYSFREITFYVDTNGKLALGLSDGTNDTYALGSTVVPLNQVTHVAVTYPGAGPQSANDFPANQNGTKMYINGVAETVTPINNASYGGLVVRNQSYQIGADGGYFGQGSIRDCKIFNRELTASEVAELARGNDLGFADEFGDHTAEKLTDGGMETWSSGTDLTSWIEGGSISVAQEAADVQGGTYSCKLTGGGDIGDSVNRWLSQNCGIVSGRRYRFSTKVKRFSGSTDSLQIGVEYYKFLTFDGTTFTASTTATYLPESKIVKQASLGSGWYSITVEFVAFAGNNRLSIAVNGTTDPYLIDDCSLVQVGTLADFRAEDYNESASKLLDRSSNNFVGVGTSVTLTGNQRHISADTIDLKNLPTSSAGLSAGEVWSNGGVLTVV